MKTMKKMLTGGLLSVRVFSSPQPYHLRKPVGIIQVTLLGVALVAGGQVMYWNEGLALGVIPFLIMLWVCALAFLSVLLCLAEMTSALPFGGGLYGFIRVTLGPYPGFLIGCCEILQSIVYSSSLLLPAGRYAAELLGVPPRFSFLFCLLLLALALAINLMGMQSFWRSNTLLIGVALALLLVYYAVSLPCVDCERYDEYNFFESNFQSDSDKTRLWFKFLPYNLWMLVGIEMLPMACADAKEPQKTVPWSILWSFIIIVVTSSLLVVTVACDAPGSLALSDISSTPMAAGFQRHLHVSERVSKALVIPALFASGSAFFFVGGKQLRSMAESGLFPSWCGASGGSYRTPHAALLVLGALSLSLLCLSYFIGGDVFMAIVACGSHATIFADIAILAAFLQFRSKFSNLEKWFYNPVGTLSVVYGMVLLVATCVVTTVLHYLAFAPLLLILAILLLATVYYSTVVRSKQGFSDEEQRVMFSAYVINANRLHKQRNRRGSTNNSGRSIASIPHSFSAFLQSKLSARKLAFPGNSISRLQHLHLEAERHNAQHDSFDGASQRVVSLETKSLNSMNTASTSFYLAGRIPSAGGQSSEASAAQRNASNNAVLSPRLQSNEPSDWARERKDSEIERRSVISSEECGVALLSDRKVKSDELLPDRPTVESSNTLRDEPNGSYGQSKSHSSAVFPMDFLSAERERELAQEGETVDFIVLSKQSSAHNSLEDDGRGTKRRKSINSMMNEGLFFLSQMLTDDILVHQAEEMAHSSHVPNTSATLSPAVSIRPRGTAADAVLSPRSLRFPRSTAASNNSTSSPRSLRFPRSSAAVVPFQSDSNSFNGHSTKAVHQAWTTNGEK